MVVSNILYFHPYLGKMSILTNIFQIGWNHQLEDMFPKGTACQLSDRSRLVKKWDFLQDSHTTQAMSLVLQKMNKK